MLKVSKMLIKEDLKELDINPIIFDDKGADVVDVEIYLANLVGKRR